MKKEIINAIDLEIAKLNELDSEGFVWWNRFKDFIENNNFSQKEMETETKKKCKIYRVIAMYPDSPFDIGDIIIWNGINFGADEPQKFESNPEKYPLIFQEVI